jgi:hypothetical protein
MRLKVSTGFAAGSFGVVFTWQSVHRSKSCSSVALKRAP